MKNPKVLIPLFVAAAIVTLYLLFKPAGSPTAVQAGSVQLPPIPPLSQESFGLPSADVATEAPAAGGSTVNVANVNAAAKDPMSMAPLQFWNSNPNAAVNPYGYLTINEAPWDVYAKAAARKMEYQNGIKPHSGAGGGCGCGGGCGGSSLAKECSQTVNPRLLDGHGGCLTTKPRFLDGAAIAGNIQYIAASYDDRDYGTHSDFIQSPAGTVVAATAGGI